MTLGKRTGCGWTDSPSRTGCLVAFALLVTLAGTAAAEDLERTHRRARESLLAVRQGGPTIRTRNPSSRTSSGTSARCTGPYTGTCFASTKQTDIEHIVATSEAHDSGLCAADRATRKRFAKDLRNLTLASPRVNRHQKSGKDAGEWLPDRNRCWFAGRVLEVKPRLPPHRRPPRGRGARSDFLPMLRHGDGAPSRARHLRQVREKPGPRHLPGTDALARYDDNRNGKITCKEARRHGIAPVHRSHPAYRFMRDGDANGVVCE